MKEYDVAAHFRERKFRPKKVRMPLSQHIGAPAIPVVKSGSVVNIGEVIGEIPEGKLGARIHASIEGVVTLRNEEIVIEQK